MKLKETSLQGCFEIEFFHAIDQRGSFTKCFHGPSLKEAGLVSEFEESFYSVNNTGVIRGMHFQLPPSDHAKVVYCNVGRLFDVIVDLRKESTTYGKCISIELSGDRATGVYIPKGMAHGFETVENNTMMTYLTSSAYNPLADSGILYSSINHQWQTERPILSPRDESFPSLATFESPF